MIIELFIGFAVLLAIIIIISIVKHIFGFVFKLAVLLLVLIVIIAGVGVFQLASKGVFSESFSILYLEGGQVMGGIDVNPSNATVIEDEAIIGASLNATALDSFASKELLVILQSNTSSAEIAQNAQDLSEASGWKTPFLLYGIVTDEDVEEVSLYPKTYVISAIDGMLG